MLIFSFFGAIHGLAIIFINAFLTHKFSVKQKKLEYDALVDRIDKLERRIQYLKSGIYINETSNNK